VSRVIVRELANGGDGVAIVDASGERRAVFVRGAALGDELELAVDFTKRPARGRLLRIERAGPTRVVPVCPDAERCGGCAWMHISIAGQEDAHRLQIQRTLPEAWSRVPLAFHPPHEMLGYRTRARLSVRASGGRAVVGFREAGGRETIEVERCVVLHPVLDGARLALGPLLAGARGHGEAQIALGAGGRPVLELTWEGRLEDATFARIEAGVNGSEWAGARVSLGAVPRPAVIGDPTPWTLGADGEPIRLAPGGFAQASERANVELGERLLSLSKDGLGGGLGGGLGAVVELFSGAGNFTVLLARHAERVVAVEASEPACDAARQNLSARGLTARVVAGLAEEHAVRKGTDLVVLDPPRTGARLVAERLALAKPRVIAYVSCDLPTLARDLDALKAAYEPFALEAFAMFPHTPHLETLAVLVRKGTR
jgi:23S rRNA (uracil1939-C5)-methyltransferase